MRAYTGSAGLITDSDMASKVKDYWNTFFTADILDEAERTLLNQIDFEGERDITYSFSITNNTSKQDYDHREEFISDYRVSQEEATFTIHISPENELKTWGKMYVFVYGSRNDRRTRVQVDAPDRSKVEAVFNVFEKEHNNSRLPTEPQTRPAIFIGHGRSALWKELKDHLVDKHSYDVIAYEVGARAGHEIRDILADALNRSSFAILVMTGEDETTDNEFQPRLNVVHELGLFQGKLGFHRAIILLEEGTQAFSNINGVQHIPFSKGNIKETFGDIIATLHREFPK